jgi:hypothetical protein
MKLFGKDLYKIINLVFAKKLDGECEYKSMCSAYQKSSSTCTDEAERSFCGIYKRF